jgi:hypothetical protein
MKLKRKTNLLSIDAKSKRETLRPELPSCSNFAGMGLFQAESEHKGGQNRGLRAEGLSGEYSGFGLHFFALNLAGSSDFSGLPCFHRGKPRR